MAIVHGSLVEDNKIKVKSVAYLTNDTSGGGFQFDTIPEYPASRVGINQVMYANPMTKEIWFEEESRELTTEELSDQRLADLEIAIANIIGGIM